MRWLLSLLLCLLACHAAAAPAPLRNARPHPLAGRWLKILHHESNLLHGDRYFVVLRPDGTYQCGKWEGTWSARREGGGWLLRIRETYTADGQRWATLDYEALLGAGLRGPIVRTDSCVHLRLYVITLRRH